MLLNLSKPEMHAVEEQDVCTREENLFILGAFLLNKRDSCVQL